MGLLLALFMAAALHAVAAFEYSLADLKAQQVQAEVKGRVIVEEWFAGRVEENQKALAGDPSRRAEITKSEADDVALEASRLSDGSKDQAKLAAKLQYVVEIHPQTLLAKTSLWWQPGPLPDIAALVFFLWWALILVCQGEAPDLDASRARNPMWEWLFSHPVAPSAVFVAEMLAPIAANPIYVTAPLYPGMIYGMQYGWPIGLLAAIVVGIPLTVALACVGRAIEIGAVLRLPPRPRGIVLGVMGWLGFTLSLLVFMGASALTTIMSADGRWLAPYAHASWPPTRALLGRITSGTFVLWHGLAYCWGLAAILMIGAAAFAAASARRGIVGQWGGTVVASPARVVPARFGGDPLYRKELLWFRRDTRALIQAVLVPLTLAALQTVNLRGMVANPMGAWNTIAGLAVVFGTYFLMTLGPKSLASEGQALWIAQTWPLGLENLLKAKAKFWALIATAIVALALVYAAWRFPGDIPALVVIAVLWWVFARTLALKTVTLVTPTSSSGEPQPISGSLRWGVLLGTFAFAIGIFTRQWNLVVGMVYSVLTAAAMWQNLRARLPYLVDPWSEVLPPAPTLLHAMVTISGMVEGMALLSGFAVSVLGRQHVAAVNAGLYGVCAILAALWVSRFLYVRGVPQREIWLWRDSSGEPRPVRAPAMDGKARVALLLLAGAAAGAVLGLGAHGYLGLLRHWPDLARAIDEAHRTLMASPETRHAYLVMSVGFAPLAEEFLFRGLLYRALDREWGGWRAIAGAAAFFAIYHPAAAWPPVAALGALNAVLFKRTGRLAPAVAAHMAYNAVVLAW